MSVDPIHADKRQGNNFNRYSYANNNPFRFVDPDGRVAIVTHMKDGSIRVSFPAKFEGAGATKENIGALKSDIAALSGKYMIDGKSTQVNFQVTEISKATPLSARNRITLTDGPTSRADGMSYAHLGGKKAVIDVQDRFVRNGTGVHEMLHLADIDDRYDRITRKSVPGDPNIMNVVPGVFDDSNVRELMNSRNNIYRTEE